MRLLNPREKTAIIQHLDALETLINHVAGQERLREKHEQARQQAIARISGAAGTRKELYFLRYLTRQDHIF